jgi:hypothetical protein
MEPFYEILKITVPALIVLLTAWLLLKKMIQNDQDRRKHEIVLQNSRTVIPIRLQAYERIILFLERISMESLLMRSNTAGMTSSQLHSVLLNTIRSEFEHNLSQQIYISPQAWEVVINARSNAIKIINTEVGNIPPTASGVDLSRQLLERIMEMDKEPTKVAIEFIKNEISKII